MGVGVGFGAGHPCGKTGVPWLHPRFLRFCRIFFFPLKLFLKLFIQFLLLIHLFCLGLCGVLVAAHRLSLAAVHGLLMWWRLLLWISGSGRTGFSSYSTQAQSSLSMWDLPNPGIELMSTALAGEFLTPGFPGSAVVKNLPASAGDAGSTPGSGRPPGGGSWSQLDSLPAEVAAHSCSCLENPVDRGAWWGNVHGVAKSQT